MDQEKYKKAIECYETKQYDEFIPLGIELLNSSNDKSEFLCQAISNSYFTKQEYDKALQVNTFCLKYFNTIDNLKNRLVITEKLGDLNEKTKTLSSLYELTKDISFFDKYLNIKLNSSFHNIPQIYEYIKSEPNFLKNIICLLSDTYQYLIYGRKYTEKALSHFYQKEINDSFILKKINKKQKEEEQIVCILYLLLPKLFYKNDIEKEYQRIFSNLEKLESFSVDRFVKMKISSYIKNNFTYYYTYFGKDTKTLLCRYHKMITKINPEKKIAISKRKNDKIKIGFFSSLIFQNHSVARDRLGVIKYLCQDEEFEVYLISSRKIEKQYFFNQVMDNITYHEIVGEVEEMKNILLNLQLDILVYPEIGMDTDIYFLAYTRYAPVQINTWGHSETSGIDVIDYYFSSKYFELDYETAQQNYSEKLILLDSLSTYYYNLDHLIKKDNIIPIEDIKKEYQLHEHYHLYGIFQTAFKYHPILMNAISNILLKDSKAFFLIIMTKNCWDEFMKYCYHFLGMNVNRVKLVDKMDQKMYCNLLHCMDILIDSYPFGGCNTSLDAFYFNKIVFTIPSHKLNGRFTTGFYKKMEIKEPICESVEELVEKSIYYMEHKEKRKELENLINERKHLIFEEEESLIEWKSQLKKLI